MFLSEWITQRGACSEAGVRVRLAVSGLFSASKGAAGHGELSDLLTPGHSQVFFTGSTWISSGGVEGWRGGEEPIYQSETARWHASQVKDTDAVLRSLLQGSWGRSLAPTVAPCALINGVRVSQRVDSHPLIWVSSGHVCRWWWMPDWAVFPYFSHILNWAIRSCTGGKACANGSELCLVFLSMFACRGMLTFKWHYLQFMVRCRKCTLNL